MYDSVDYDNVILNKQQDIYPPSKFSPPLNTPQRNTGHASSVGPTGNVDNVGPTGHVVVAGPTGQASSVAPGGEC